LIPWLRGEAAFPPIGKALKSPNGLLCAGGELTPRRILDAYTRGIFPWFSEGDPVLWWSPNPRTVLVPSRLHVSHSLKKRLKKGNFLVTIDAAFGRVLDGCAAPRANDSGTWLTGQMRRAYTSLHIAGLAHSVEVWMDGELAGGIYGVAIGRMFFGESMFSRRTDGSKIAMARLAAQLDRWRFPMIDCQLETDHLLSLGAEHMPRRQFVKEVERLVKEPEPSWQFDEDLRGSIEHLPRTLLKARG